MDPRNLKIGDVAHALGLPATPPSSGPASPLPWRTWDTSPLGGGQSMAFGEMRRDDPVGAVFGCGPRAEANATYIVQAANAYPGLTAEVARLREALDDAQVFARRILQATDPREDAGIYAHAEHVMHDISAALAATKGA